MSLMPSHLQRHMSWAGDRSQVFANRRGTPSAIDGKLLVKLSCLQRDRFLPWLQSTQQGHRIVELYSSMAPRESCGQASSLIAEVHGSAITDAHQLLFKNTSTKGIYHPPSPWRSDKGSHSNDLSHLHEPILSLS